MIVDMFLRACLVFASTIGIAHACRCSEPSEQLKINRSDVIFRGTLIELRDSRTDHSDRFYQDTKKIAVFRVARAWKGDVGPFFEMPAVKETSMCIGFWPDFLKVGMDLLVYANRSRIQGREDEYYTGICGFHKPASGSKDLKILGPGEDPRKQENSK